MKRLLTVGVIAVLAIFVAIGAAAAQSYTQVWDTLTVPNGSHVITATAYDVAGNSSTATITVNVANTMGTIMTMRASKSPIYLDTTNDNTLLQASLLSFNMPVASQKVSLYSWDSSSTVWKIVAWDMPWAAGAQNYQYRVYPTRTTWYKAVFKGNLDYLPATSNEVKMYVWKEVK
jgi:hypothetical protein